MIVFCRGMNNDYINTQTVFYTILQEKKSGCFKGMSNKNV